MKKTFLATISLILILHLVSCNNEQKGDCKYDYYTEMYSSDSFIVLRNNKIKLDTTNRQLATVDKGKITNALNKKLFGLFPFVNPEDGHTISVDSARDFIANYQKGLSDNDTRYADFHFVNIQKFLTEILKNQPELKDLGMRIYLGKDDKGVIKFVLGPILNTTKLDNDNKIMVEPLWVTQPDKYSAFDYGSTCPENCTNNKDKTGYTTLPPK